MEIKPKLTKSAMAIVDGMGRVCAWQQARHPEQPQDYGPEFSFLEMRQHLGRDAAWVTPLALRASLIQQVRGKWSAILRAFLRLMLLGPEGLHSSGYPVMVGGSYQLLFAKVHTMLSDGDGLRQALEWLGASAMKLCFRHWNVFNPHSDMASRCSSTRQYVTTSCTDPSAFRSWRGEDLQPAVALMVHARQRHASAEIPYARVEEIQQAYGYKFTSDGLLSDSDLGAIIDWPNVFKYDWVHVMLSGGVMVRAAWSVLEACEANGLPGQEALCEFLKGWQVPKAAQHGARDVRSLWRFFDAKSISGNRKRQGVRCNASELLALTRCLDEFISTKIPDDERIAAHKAFFSAAQKTLDLLMHAKMGIATCREIADPLALSCREQLEKFIEVHGPGEVIPKFHWAFDIVEQVRNTDFLMDAFVIERLHLRARQAADRTMWTQGYEASLCAGVINAQVSGSGSKNGLEGKTTQFPHPSLSHVRVGDMMYFQGKRMCIGDWVQRGAQIGQVLACAEEGSDFYIIVQVASITQVLSRRGRICTLVDGRQSLWGLADSHVVAAWRPSTADDHVYVMMQ